MMVGSRGVLLDNPVCDQCESDIDFLPLKENAQHLDLHERDENVATKVWRRNLHDKKNGQYEKAAFIGKLKICVTKIENDDFWMREVYNGNVWSWQSASWWSVTEMMGAEHPYLNSPDPIARL